MHYKSDCNFVSPNCIHSIQSHCFANHPRLDSTPWCLHRRSPNRFDTETALPVLLGADLQKCPSLRIRTNTRDLQSLIQNDEDPGPRRTSNHWRGSSHRDLTRLLFSSMVIVDNNRVETELEDFGMRDNNAATSQFPQNFGGLTILVLPPS